MVERHASARVDRTRGREGRLDKAAARSESQLSFAWGLACLAAIVLILLGGARYLSTRRQTSPAGLAPRFPQRLETRAAPPDIPGTAPPDAAVLEEYPKAQVAQNPGDVSSHLELARTHLVRKDLDGARRETLEALRLA